MPITLKTSGRSTVSLLDLTKEICNCNSNSTRCTNPEDSSGSLQPLTAEPNDMYDLNDSTASIESSLLVEAAQQPKQNSMRKRASCSDLVNACQAPQDVAVPFGCRDDSSIAAFGLETSPSSVVAPKAESEQSFDNAGSGKRSRSNSLVRGQSKQSDNTVINAREPMPLILPSPIAGNDMDPDTFLLQLVAALHPGIKKLHCQPALELDDYFNTITEDQMTRYNMEIVNVARSNDLVALQRLYATQGRDALNCFNRFGEGLLNLSCRRGFTEMTRFLLSSEVDLDVRVRDDFGRTPLHDACWNPEPQLDICSWIMQKDPSLFLVTDKRGFTPFHYARKTDWPIWRQFLVDNLEHLHRLADPEVSSRFSGSL